MSKNALIEMKNNIVNKVQDRVENMMEEGSLHLPANYSPQNALNSAWLKLQNTENNKKQPVLEGCDKASIANALLRMVTMGLNPEKEQCYFITYGKMLNRQPRYFGKQKNDKQVEDVEGFYTQVIFEGDEVETEIEYGNEKIIKHKSQFESKLKGNIIGAYSVARFNDERPNKTVLMTMDQITNAWKQGQTYGKYKGTPHDKFEEAMAKKTVINRLATGIINASDDSNVMVETFKEAADIAHEQKTDEELEEEANQGEVIDIENEAPEEPTQNEQPKEEEEPEKQDKSQAELDMPEEEYKTTDTEGPDFD